MMTTKTYRNGVNFPTKETTTIPSTDSDVNIAAIDFGTTACSLAYCFKSTAGSDIKHREVVKVKLDGQDFRVPSAILMDDNGEILGFGNKARSEYSRQLTRHGLFQHIKMQLQHDSSVSRKTTVKSSNGKEYFIMEVIAMMLKYIKERLFTSEFLKDPRNPKPSDFHWVITVPALWKASGKQMMRQAAYKAGIASYIDPISKLTPVMPGPRSGIARNEPVAVPADKTNPEMLSLALEPEAAALFCREHAKRPLEGSSAVANTKCYMVVDIGGGTTDITAHKINPSGAIGVILPPSGDAVQGGGTSVNEKFKKFLANELLKDSNFQRFLTKTKRGVSNQKFNCETELYQIVHETFETQKKLFGEKESSRHGESDEAVIELKYEFMKEYKEEGLIQCVTRLGDSRVRIRGNYLYISYSKMEEFFADSVAAIEKSLKDCLQKLERSGYKVDTVFFVGGFGGCPYMVEKLEAKIRSSISWRCNFYRPTGDYTTAVVQGAVLFRKHPELVQTRVTDATYGIDCRSKFVPALHDESYSCRSDDDPPEKKCKYLFVPFVLSGDEVTVREVITATYNPAEHNQSAVDFSIYRSSIREPFYSNAPDGKPLKDIQEIGRLRVQMPIQSGDKLRKVKLTFDFSHTEIQVRGYDCTSKEEYQTVVDFLSG